MKSSLLKSIPAPNSPFSGIPSTPLTKGGYSEDAKAYIGDRKGNATVAVETSDHDNLEKQMRLIAEKGDRETFNVIFQYFAPRTKSFLLRYGLSPEKAEDITQDVMVTIWHKATQFNPDKARLSTWIFRIARNKFIDYTRKQKYPEVNVEDHIYDMAAPEVTDKPLHQKQEAETIETALEKLNADQKKAVELSYYQEMTHAQISEFLTIPLGTVKSRLRLAFKILRKELGDKK